MRLWIFIGLIVLSIVGIAIMDFSAAWGVWYWLAMTVVFGIASIVLVNNAAHQRDERRHGLVRPLVLHWLAVLASVSLVFLMQWSLQLTPSTAGLFALLVLASGCVLAGIHFEWRLAVLGGVLAATFVAAVLAADFFWATLLIAVIGGAVLIYTLRRRQGSASG